MVIVFFFYCSSITREKQPKLLLQRQQTICFGSGCHYGHVVMYTVKERAFLIGALGIWCLTKWRSANGAGVIVASRIHRFSI